MFSLWINHGKRPRGAGYAYVVTPQRDADALDAFAQALPVRVLANTPQVQAVGGTDGNALQAVFYEAGKVAGGEKWGTVAADAPCLLMLRREGNGVAATVCNPMNQGGRVRATTINTAMKVAAAHALAALAREPVTDEVKALYPNETLEFGTSYLIPKPFDRRLLVEVSSAVAAAAMESGVARRRIDLAAYRAELARQE